MHTLLATWFVLYRPWVTYRIQFYYVGHDLNYVDHGLNYVGHDLNYIGQCAQNGTDSSS